MTKSGAHVKILHNGDIAPSSSLNCLIGLRLLWTGCAGAMRTFGFGKYDVKETERSDEWALHIQCSWRFQSDGGIITGATDFYETLVEEAPGASCRDRKMNNILQNARLAEALGSTLPQDKEGILNCTSSFIVEAIDVGPLGDLSIGLSGGFELLAFPDGSRVEYWRLFKRGAPGSHYVCGPSRAE